MFPVLTPTDKKHYDWAHLAMRYWPTRVDARNKAESLGVAHRCCWVYHPNEAEARAGLIAENPGFVQESDENPEENDATNEN